MFALSVEHIVTTSTDRQVILTRGTQERKSMAKIMLLAGVTALATACVSERSTWYEQRCEQIGLTKGTADFDQCIAREKAWIEADRKRGASAKNR